MIQSMPHHVSDTVGAGDWSNWYLLTICRQEQEDELCKASANVQTKVTKLIVWCFTVQTVGYFKRDMKSSSRLDLARRRECFSSY